MFDNLAYEIENLIAQIGDDIPLILKILLGLWVINIINWKTGSYLHLLGIRPRRIGSLLGILFAPIPHGNFNHLFFNSIPLFALGIFLMSYGLTVFYTATVVITVLGGLMVWLFGRRGNHIGASGLIMGYFGFLLASAYEQPTISALFLGGIALYYFGGILLSVIPTEERVSWEGHLLGLVAGVITMFICTRYLYLF